MRELKFRVWDIDKKEYVEFEYDFYLGMDGRVMWFDTQCNETLNPDNYIIEQFTGLQDCEDKDIYEGDILDDDDDGLYRCVWCENRKHILFTDGHCNYEPSESFYLTIIGNINENPELL